MDEPTANYSLLSWNVRGLNNPTKQEEVKQVVQLQRPMLVCIQETKLARSLVPWFLYA
jgi:exonuclease III